MEPADLHSAEVVRGYLMYFLVPLWLLAGFADWACHRRARIEDTTGPTESAIHLLMLWEVGIAVLAGLFLEINALVIAVALVALVAHHATAIWDVTFASRRRPISPTEQHVHSLLEIIPLMAVSCLVFLAWPQCLALFGLADGGDYRLVTKRDPLPFGYVVSLLAAIGLLQVVPYVEELIRGLRAARAGQIPASASARPLCP